MVIKVVIADDHALLAESLQYMLEQDEDIKITGIAADGKKAVEICREKQPDLILMDIKMPAYSGLQAARRIKEVCPDIKIVFLTTFESNENISTALINGTDGFLLKEIRPEELITALKCIYRGFIVMNNSIKKYLKGIAEMGIMREKVTDWDNLKQEDIEIIKLISDGKNNREIALTLNYTEGTIKNRISRILKIFNVSSRTELVVFCLKNNII